MIKRPTKLKENLTKVFILNIAYIIVFSLSTFFYKSSYGEGLFFDIPPGLDLDLKIPKDNPLTKEKVELGKQLYFDTRLSADNSVSCATCHNPSKAFGDGMATSTGIKGQKGDRNAPTVINTTYNDFQFWDGRAGSLEEQALGPIQNPIEMGFTLSGVIKRLNEIEGYRQQFQKIFGAHVTAEGISKAIASFERTVLSGGSRWDDFNLGNEDALTDSEKRGWELFRGKAHCSSCHVAFNLTDNDFHNLGLGMNKPNPDLGRYNVTKNVEDKGAFKTPTLRDISRTSPYMHNGSVKTLEEVIEFYNKGGEPNPWLDRQIRPLHLTDQEKGDLLAFLRSLDGGPIAIEPPRLP